jgi:phage shock protein A
VQRAKDKTEQMQARAAAVEELTAAGTLSDFTSQGDDIDRQLREIQSSGQVEDELAKMKAELGTGGADDAKELPSAADGAPSADEPAAAPDAAPADAGGDTAQTAG